MVRGKEKKRAQMLKGSWPLGRALVKKRKTRLITNVVSTGRRKRENSGWEEGMGAKKQRKRKERRNYKDYWTEGEEKGWG